MLLRLVLAIPHLVWLSIYATAAIAIAFVTWLFVLVLGRVPKSLHRFLANYTRYTAHLLAYLCLAADPYPGFSGDGSYPIDVEIDRRRSSGGSGPRCVSCSRSPPSCSRWRSPERPCSRPSPRSGRAGSWSPSRCLRGSPVSCAAQMPRGMRDAAAYAIGYGAQTTAYALLVTDRYPDATPGRADPAPELPPHPVAVEVDDALARPRLLVLFRLPLCIPHLLWLTAWSAFAIAAWILAWLAALVSGRVPRPLHRFLAAYVRAWMHLLCFLCVVGRQFPGFVGREGGYPIDLRIAAPVRQSRLGVLLRLVLALPAALLSSAYRVSSSSSPCSAGSQRSWSAGCRAGSAISAWRPSATRPR